jgi:hypothetical protein
MSLLLDHLNQISHDPFAIDCAVTNAKQQLFIGCDAADKAQSTFEKQAWANRASLLLFP